MTRDYSIIPLKINEYTDLADFDEYEAKEHGWPQQLIRDALLEIQLREEESNEAGELGLSVYDDIERHCPDWYDEEPDGASDAELARYEATHYVWYDENDQPHIGEGDASNIINAVQLSEAY